MPPATMTQWLTKQVTLPVGRYHIVWQTAMNGYLSQDLFTSGVFYTVAIDDVLVVKGSCPDVQSTTGERILYCFTVLPSIPV